jgi:hypothetical protein
MCCSYVPASQSMIMYDNLCYVNVPASQSIILYDNLCYVNVPASQSIILFRTTAQTTSSQTEKFLQSLRRYTICTMIREKDWTIIFCSKINN